MIKVIIADDEVRVCQLIYNLIDWQSVNMDVVGVAHNGIEALELIKIHKPNLVITDIRMPGYDGLELIEKGKEIDSDIEWIIISGYNHFEYAQSGIKYGVCDYLLKPIKKDELLNTLMKINEKFKLKMQMISEQAESHKLIQNDIDKLRQGLFAEILLTSKQVSKSNRLIEVNKSYHYNFKEGRFKVIIIKMDYELEKNYDSNIKLLQDKINQAFHLNLKDICFDVESYIEDSMLYGILNYDSKNSKEVRKKIKSLLSELRIQKNIFKQTEFTIAVGKSVGEFENIKESYELAKLAIGQRIISGAGHIIDQVSITTSYEFTNQLLSKLNKSMGIALEILDKEAVIKSIKDLLENIKMVVDLSGVEALKLAEEACHIYTMLLRNNQLILDDLDEFYKEFCLYADRLSTIDKIFNYLTKHIGDSLDKIIEDKKQADTRPIRMAKKYIQENFAHPISLEEVSDYVGFNSSYFSTLFKKETGINFLEYLLDIRMSYAKELLKETNLSMIDICEKVGYSDLRHFTKTFKKNAGISPNEYRKLYA